MWIASRLIGFHRCIVYRYVIRMAVAPDRIKCDHNLGSQSPHESHKRFRNIVLGRLGQGLWMFIVFRPHHTRIAVVKEVNLFKTQPFSCAS